MLLQIIPYESQNTMTFCFSTLSHVCHQSLWSPSSYDRPFHHRWISPNHCRHHKLLHLLRLLFQLQIQCHHDVHFHWKTWHKRDLRPRSSFCHRNISYKFQKQGLGYRKCRGKIRIHMVSLCRGKTLGFGKLWIKISKDLVSIRVLQHGLFEVETY